MTSPLESIALRVEAASGAEDDLFREAFDLCFPKPTRVWESEDREVWTTEYENHHIRSWAFEAFLEVKAYLDAAMTLPPPGATTCLAMEDRHSGRWRWELRHGYGVRTSAWAATPALALVAAALRARAAGEGEG
jgi:hypothetical protein